MAGRHCSHSAEFKRQVVAEYHGGETLHALARLHDLSRNLIRIRGEKADAGMLDEDVTAAEMLGAYEARIAALERLVGRRRPRSSCLKGGSSLRTLPEKRAYIRDRRPRGVSVQRGCELMGVARLT